jgi:hypothetical protein
MARHTDDDPSTLVRVRAWLVAALGRGGLVLLVIAGMLAVLVLALLVVTWFSGLGPEVPGREHY